MPTSTNQPRRTLLLTGASRGIGHATVIRFSSAGWRVITCSRHPFPEECPWEAGPEDHIQVDLADEQNALGAISEIKGRLEGGPGGIALRRGDVVVHGPEAARQEAEAVDTHPAEYRSPGRQS